LSIVQPIALGDDSDAGARSVAEKSAPKDVVVIGRWGEALVYRWLQEHYKAKPYYECKYEETNTGFKMTGFRTKNGTREPLTLQVIWFNKHSESGHPIDLQIIKNGKIRYIEVKTTRSGGKAELFISQREWGLMMNQNEQYRLFRVYGAGERNPHIAKIKNPAEQVRAGGLVPKRASFVL
jgi:hypothetical protein